MVPNNLTSFHASLEVFPMALKMSVNRVFRHRRWSAMWQSILSLAAVASVFAPTMLAENSKASPMNVNLPQSVGGWTLSGPPKKVEPTAIFDYMDGAGELYLGYRFKFLEVYEYRHSGESDILVELYWMASSDDAYGLLSGDWGGEVVDLSSVERHGTASIMRALYGAGLLRIWSCDL